MLKERKLYAGLMNIFFTHKYGFAKESLEDSEIMTAAMAPLSARRIREEERVNQEVEQVIL